MAAWGYEFHLLVLKVSLTRSLRSLVRDTFKHEKIKFVSPRCYVISSIYADPYPALLGLKLGNRYLEKVIYLFCRQTTPE